VSKQLCEWFALCTNQAAGVVEHPVLGQVPTCQRCAAKLSLTLVCATCKGHGTFTERSRGNPVQYNCLDCDAKRI
jgi:hypothetical protein